MGSSRLVLQGYFTNHSKITNTAVTYYLLGEFKTLF